MKKRISSTLLLIFITVIGASAHYIKFHSSVSYTNAQPTGDNGSVANWTGAAFDAANVGGSGINADGGTNNGTANDATTYVANNQPRQGQTFTTGPNPNGYELTSVTARMTGYTNNNATGNNRGAWDLNAFNGPVQVEIGRVSGTAVTPLSRQLFTLGGEDNPGAGRTANGAGDYITFHLPFTVYLEPNTTYSFDFWVGNGSANYFEWHGISSDFAPDAYTNGTAYTRDWWGGPITPLAGDRVFQVDMTARAESGSGLVHPGTLHSQADLDLMAARVAAGEEPWISGYNVLINSPYAQTWWPAYDVDYIDRGGYANNYTRCQEDAQAIYELALRWKITGDTAYADHAVYIANVWSGLLGLRGDTNRSLAAGICGNLFACAGDLLSTYSGWAAADQQAYKDMMMRVFYPENLDFLWRQHDTFWRNGGNTHYRLNWITANMASMAAIGILCDNRAVYEQAVDFFKFGPNNGNVRRAAWYVHPGGLGQGEEAGRDQGHNLGGWCMMAMLCQMGWNQGDDLFGYDNNRVLRVFEYNAKYNLWNGVPYARHQTCDLGYTEGGVSGKARGLGNYFQYELVYNHYVNVMGIDAPWSRLAAAATRPEPQPNKSIHPSQEDWFGLGTLTYSHDTPTNDVAPSGLHALWSRNEIILDWWGSARATGYAVKRATASGGPYTQIGTVAGPDLNFTDTAVTNHATYYYMVTAQTPSGDIDSAPLRVAQELVTHYTFEGNADDVAGNRNAALHGGTTGLPGYAAGHGGGQAIDLDGADDYVQLPAGSGNYLDITVAAWVRWDGGSAWQRIFAFGSEIEKTMYLTPFNGGGPEWGFTTTKGGNFVGDASYYLGGGSALPVGTWAHVAVTLNGDVMTLYVNGVPRDTRINTLIDPLYGQPFCYLGKSMYNADPLFNGRIDDFRIYNYALSGDEIYSLGSESANHAPVFSSDPIIRSVPENAAISETLSASDTDGGTLTFSKLVGPDWLTVESNGALSGTPSRYDLGEHYAVVRVADSSGATDDATLWITVTNVNDAPVWSLDPLSGGGVATDEAYSLSVAKYASDVDIGDSIAFSKVSGPAWLSVAGNGGLTGTPGAGDEGTNSFVLRVTDLAGMSNDVVFTVHVQPAGLIAHYGFESNLVDSVGGFDGVGSGSPSYAAGQDGTALVLDGTNDYITLPADVAKHQSLTVAAWVNWGGSNDWQRIFDFGSDTANYMFLTPSSASSTMKFGINGGSGQQSVEARRLATNTWEHVAVTLEGDTVRLYINGRLLAVNAALTLNPNDAVQTLCYLGKSQFPSDPLFNGMIDDVRIYNYALSDGQIALLAGASPGSTMAYWNFEEGTANTYVPYAPASDGQYDGSILDVSGNGNNLSVWSGSWEWYRADVPAAATPQTGAANTISVQNANDWNALSAIGTDLTTWNPAEWTIEAAFKVDRISGYQTLVGRDSYGAYSGEPRLAALYVQIRPDGYLGIRFTDNAGNNWNLASAGPVVEVNEWQAAVAVSDGETLSLYLKNITVGEPDYTLMGTLDISGSEDSALSTGTGDGSDWDAGVFTVGRGLYDGVHTDRVFGYIDDVRLSGAALSPEEFLYSIPLPPAAPTGLSAESSDAQVSLSWNAVPGASSYNVKRSLSSGTGYGSVDSPVSTGSVDMGLTNGTVYYYVVSSVGLGGEGTNSVEISVIPSVAVSSKEFVIADLAVDGTSFSLTVSNSVPGHLYGVLASDSLAPPAWTNITMEAGNSSNLQFSIPITGIESNRFFKLDVQQQ